jgi:hypothetical protein
LAVTPFAGQPNKLTRCRGTSLSRLRCYAAMRAEGVLQTIEGLHRLQDITIVSSARKSTIRAGPDSGSARDEIVDDCLDGCGDLGDLGGALDQAERMLVPFASRNQDQIPSIWITSKSRPERSDAIHSLMREKRRKVADLDKPDATGAGTSPSGSRA